MDAELKAKWLKALRSGKYEQARYHLRDGKALCCIGVAYVCAKGRRPRFEKTSRAWEEIGLTKEEAGPLIDMNDWDGKGFLEIANYIERNL